MLTNLKKNLAQFFADHLFQRLKKVYLQILKKPGPFFYFSPFSNIKNGILANLQKNLALCFSYPLSEILKKYTCKY